MRDVWHGFRPMKVRVFIACSLDSFIDGPNDEFYWLEGPDCAEDTFTPFFKGIGATLMGRGTYVVASSFEGDWPYGDTPIIVATNRPLRWPNPRFQDIKEPLKSLSRRPKRCPEAETFMLMGAI